MMVVNVIACCGQKGGFAAPARHLYRSDLFKKSLAWVQYYNGRNGPVVVLSAKHGVVDIDETIEPYDVALGDMRVHDRRVWAARVHADLFDRFGDDAIYRCIIGDDYRYALQGFPFIEDVIRSFGTYRKNCGYTGRRAVPGIGVIKRYLGEFFNPFSGAHPGRRETA